MLWTQLLLQNKTLITWWMKETLIWLLIPLFIQVQVPNIQNPNFVIALPVTNLALNGVGTSAGCEIELNMFSLDFLWLFKILDMFP